MNLAYAYLIGHNAGKKYPINIKHTLTFKSVLYINLGEATEKNKKQIICLSSLVLPFDYQKK